ncbi:transposase [Aliikangiella marina]|uniref:Transposase n=1 Tax=Aliikangiella marina TaxID=1712262 RepID=A0A545TCK2_9GAMM|nr:transposase [Aliikangiella marina]TQV74921.1 transposase [Aliikangiella marina]
MQYRRADVKGGTYFFTVNLAERNKTLLVDRVNELRDAFKRVKTNHPFKMDAIVILPDHLHAIWTLPKNDSDFATRWGLIKANFSRSIAKNERINPSRTHKGERGIWQRRYWEHLIRDELDYQSHMDYVYYNPVKHGYVKNVIDWPYSSFHRDVEVGIYSADWGESDDSDGLFGERR